MGDRITDKLHSFEQLRSWQHAADLAKEVYRITKKFPAHERYALSDQVQRSAISISANIAEGFGRIGSQEKSNYYNIAYGSLLETKSHLLVAERIGYCSNSDLENVLVLIDDLQRMIGASRKAVRQL